MAIAVEFSPNGLTTAIYDRFVELLKESGNYPVPGVLSHTAFGSPDALRIFEVYESPEAFQAAGAILGPVMQELQVDPGGPPVISEVHLRY